MFNRKKVFGLKKIDKVAAGKTRYLNRKIMIPALIGLLTLLFIEVWAVNRLSSYGDKLNQIKSAQSKLELENQLLANEIALKNSLSFIEERSTLLGFLPVKNVEYLKSPVVADAR